MFRSNGLMACVLLLSILVTGCAVKQQPHEITAQERRAELDRRAVAQQAEADRQAAARRADEEAWVPSPDTPPQELVDCLKKADSVWGWESQWGYHCQDIGTPGTPAFDKALNMTVKERQHNFYAIEKNRRDAADRWQRKHDRNPCSTSYTGTRYVPVGNQVVRVQSYDVNPKCFQ